MAGVPRSDQRIELRDIVPEAIDRRVARDNRSCSIERLLNGCRTRGVVAKGFVRVWPLWGRESIQQQRRRRDDGRFAALQNLRAAFGVERGGDYRSVGCLVHDRAQARETPHVLIEHAGCQVVELVELVDRDMQPRRLFERSVMASIMRLHLSTPNVSS